MSVNKPNQISNAKNWVLDNKFVLLAVGGAVASAVTLFGAYTLLTAPVGKQPTKKSSSFVGSDVEKLQIALDEVGKQFGVDLATMEKVKADFLVELNKGIVHMHSQTNIYRPERRELIY